MPRTHQDSVDHGAELEVTACLADQSGDSWSVSAGWDLVQLDWSLRRDERPGSIRFAARIPAMYTRVRRFVRVVLVRRGKDDVHARTTPSGP
jgi:hypothetical protein